MAPLEDFEALLKEVVKAKRLSASKITKLTEIGMDCMESDTQLVSLLFRTHKSLPPTAKVSSLYVFDAISRKARSQAKRAGASGSDSEKGNCATFLIKLEGILDGLFRDMASVGTTEAKEKTRKILDLWAKGNTFPTTVLSRLADIVKQANQETITSDGATVVQPSTTPPGSPPPRSIAQPEIPKTANTADPQATLLALLTKAAQVIPSGPTPSQTPPSIDATHLASTLHQAYQAPQTAPNHIPVADPVARNNSPFPTSAHNQPPRVSDPRRPKPFSPDRRERHTAPAEDSGARDYHRHRSPRENGQHPQRDYSRQRRGFDEGRPGYTNRGQHQDQNEHGFQPNSPIRDRFRNVRSEYGEREPDRSHQGVPADHSRPMDPRRRRHSRSASPRRSTADAARAPLSSAQNAQAVVSPSNLDQGLQTGISPIPTAPSSGTHTPSTPSAVITPSPAVAPSSEATEAKDTSLSVSEVAAPSAQEGGLENFNIATFDFTDPASWIALGKMWEVTNGKPPSQEELMHFISMSSAALQQQSEMWVNGGNGMMWQDGMYSQGMHMNGNHNRYQRNATTDAIVLGQSDNTQSYSNSHGDGRVQRGWSSNRSY